MADSMRYRLDVGNRELLMSRLRERLGIEKDRWKGDVVDAALVHTLESIENMEQLRGEVNPRVLNELQTSVVRCGYRTFLELKTADTEDYRL